MATKKLVACTSGTPEATDIFYVVKDPSGTPLDRKVTLSALVTFLGGFSGSISANQVAFGTGANAIGGSANFTYTPTNTSLAITGDGSNTIINEGAAGGHGLKLTTTEGNVTFAPGGGYSVRVDAGYLLMNANIVFLASKSIGAPADNATTLTFQAYDVDGMTNKTFMTLTTGNTPDLTIAPPSGGSVNIQGVYKANDGTEGMTGTVTLAGLISLTVKNGLITGTT